MQVREWYHITSHQTLGCYTRSYIRGREIIENREHREKRKRRLLLQPTEVHVLHGTQNNQKYRTNRTRPYVADYSSPTRPVLKE